MPVTRGEPIWAIAASAREASSRAGSVGVMPVGPRSNRVTPSAVSSPATAWVSAGWVRFTARAARVRLP